tara:strand:+ start:142 stop:507 length:366 start_codon:yes stop_codon:yes gene_type:complete
MGLKDLMFVSYAAKVVRKVKSAYSKTANQGLFGSVMLLWAITTVQKLGSHLRLVMLRTLQKVLRVPLIGLINVFGLVEVGVRKILLSLNDMLRAVGPKGNVYKAIKGTESVEIVEDNRTNG